MTSPRGHFTIPGSPNPSAREVPTRPQTGPILPAWCSPAKSHPDTPFALPDWATQVAQSPPDKLNNSQSSLVSLGSSRSAQGHVPEQSRKSRNVGIQAQVGSLDDDLQRIKDKMDSQQAQGLDRLGQHLDERIDILVGGLENHVKDTIERMREEQNERFGQTVKQACVDASEAARKEASNVVDTMASTMTQKLEDTTMMIQEKLAAEQRLRTAAESNRQASRVDPGALENLVVETCVRRLSAKFEDGLKICRDECSALRASIASVEAQFGENLASMQFKVAQDGAMLRESTENGLRAELEEERTDRKEQLAALRAMLKDSFENSLRRELEEERTERKEQCAALRACFEATCSSLSNEETIRMSEATEKADAIAKQASANAMNLVEATWSAKLEDQRRQLSKEIEAVTSRVDTSTKQLESEISMLVTGVDTIRIDLQALEASSRTQAGCMEENAWNITKFNEQVDALRSELTDFSCAQLALRADITTLQSKAAAAAEASVQKEDEDSLTIKAQAEIAGVIAAATSKLMEAVENERSQRLAQAELFSERLEACRSDVHRVLEEELVKLRKVAVEQQRALERCAPLEVTRDLNEALGSLRKAFEEELEKNDRLRAKHSQSKLQSGSLDGSEDPEKSFDTEVMTKVDSAVTDRLSKVETMLTSVKVEVERMSAQAVADDGQKNVGVHEPWHESSIDRLLATLTGDLDALQRSFNKELNALQIETTNATKALQSRILAVEAQVDSLTEVGQLREEAILLLQPQIVENTRRLEDLYCGTDKKIESLASTFQSQISEIIDQNAVRAFNIADMQQPHASLEHSVNNAPRRESSQALESPLSQPTVISPSQAMEQSKEEIDEAVAEQSNQSQCIDLEDSLRNLIVKVDKKLRITEESVGVNQYHSPQQEGTIPSPGLRPWDDPMSPAVPVDAMDMSWSSVPKQAAPSSTSAAQTDADNKEQKPAQDLIMPLLTTVTSMPAQKKVQTKSVPCSAPFSISGGVSPRHSEAPKDPEELMMQAISTLREENSWLRDKNCEISERLGIIADQSGQEGPRVGAALRGVSPPGFKTLERQNIDAQEKLSSTWGGVPRTAAPIPQSARGPSEAQTSKPLQVRKQPAATAQRTGVSTNLGTRVAPAAGSMQTSLRQPKMASHTSFAANVVRSPATGAPAGVSNTVSYAPRSARR